VPDLYRGKLGVEAEEAHHLMSNLDWKGAVEDIRGAARYLREVEGARKVGVTGFCMGGALTLAAGVLVEEVDAVAPFYGVPGAGLADCAKMRVPVQAHFGQTDSMAGFSDPAAADALEEALKASGVEHTVIRHPGVGHAFMNDLPAAIERKRKLGQGEHVQAEVDRAMAQMTDFFKAKLA
jgi:carboxymethylenebutenolidase